MKKLLFLFLFAAFASCGNGGSAKSSETDSVTKDTSFSGSVITDTTGASGMNADTTGMSNAK